MPHISWHDAYPDHPDRGHIAVTYGVDDELWDVTDIDIADTPTRPAEPQLLPAHKHNDGHWCHDGMCSVDPAKRSYMCWPCELRDMEKRDWRKSRGH